MQYLEAASRSTVLEMKIWSRGAALLPICPLQKENHLSMQMEQIKGDDHGGHSFSNIMWMNMRPKVQKV